LIATLIVTTRYVCAWCGVRLKRVTTSIEQAEGPRKMVSCDLSVDDQHVVQVDAA
jgi:hypothetical protein